MHVSDERKKRMGLSFADILRKAVLAWVIAAAAEYLLLPGSARGLEGLDGIAQMSLPRMALTAAAIFILLSAVSRVLPLRAERWMLFAGAGALAAVSLCASFTWAFLAAWMLVLGVLLVYALGGWNGTRPAQPMPCAEQAGWKGLAAAGAIAFFALVSLWTVCRVYSFSTPTFDFSIFAQMFYSMKTEGLPITTVERDGALSHFAVHVSPIYYLLLPFYWLAPTPATLQVLQAAVLATAVIPLWKLGKQHGLTPPLRTMLCFLLLLYPAYAGGASYDIHENAFLTPLILWLFYGIDRKNGVVTDAAALLGRLADGSMRDGLSLMDQVLGDGNITVDSVLSSTGLAGSLRTVQLMELIQSRDSAGALRLFGELWQDGKDPDMLLEELAGLLRDILLMQAAPHTCEQLLSGNYDDASLSRFTGTMTPAEVLSALETVQDVQEQMGRSRNLRMTVELCLISLCDPSLSDSTASLRARISRLEQQVANGVPVQATPAVSPAPAKKAAPVREKAAPVQPAVPVDQPDDRPPWEEEPPVRPVIDDRPPWDEPPLPDEPPEEYPPLPEEPPLPVEPRYERRPAPRQDPEPSVPVARDERWTEFMDLARQELKGGVFSLLYQCSGTFGEDELTISAPDFPFGQLSQQANQQKLRDCAAKFYGRSVQVKVVNSESGAPRATRSLDELKKFDVVKFQ